MRKAKNLNGFRNLTETKFRDNRLTPRMERRFQEKEALKRKRKMNRDVKKWPPSETHGSKRLNVKRSMKPPLLMNVIRWLIRMPTMLRSLRRGSRFRQPLS